VDTLADELTVLLNTRDPPPNGRLVGATLGRIKPFDLLAGHLRGGIAVQLLSRPVPDQHLAVKGLPDNRITRGTHDHGWQVMENGGQWTLTA
jgi:hypothetical protein